MEQQEDIWKQKYLDNLDKLEKAEATWRTLENQLRLGINRVALAAQGVDAELDQHLSLLRKSIRNSDDYDGLDRIVENISTTVKKLDQQRQNDRQNDRKNKQKKENEPLHILQSMAKSITFPKESNKQAKSLLKKMGKEKSDVGLASCSQELAVLINHSFDLSSRLKSDQQVSQPSILQRLFGGNASQVNCAEDASVSGEIQPSPPFSLPPSPPPPPPPSPEYNPIESPITPLKYVDGATDKESVDKRLGEFCFQLLCFISFPDVFEDSVNHLKDQVSKGVSSEEAITVLRLIAGMVARVQKHIENEKNDLQEFLKQLTDNLQEIDLHLSGAEAERLASVKSTHSLDEAVNAQVKQIQKSVDSASTLDQLKDGVNERLQAIKKHLDLHHQQQDRHQQILENALRLSNSRLVELEKETVVLQDKLTQEHDQAIHDTLTGIFNRLAFEERMEQEYSRWKRYKNSLSILVFDIDYFKKVNDTWGHKAGDKALKLIAGNLQKNLRESDFLARYGGEEFVVIMPETEIKAALAAANKLREAVQACEFHYQDRRVSITVSCGVSQFKKSDTIESAFQRADSYLYMAKQAGRNRCHSQD